MPNWKKVLTSGSAGELLSLNAPSITGSLLGTASFANTASYVNTLNQNVIITGSLTAGSSSAGPSENTITLGARDNGGEGGQLGFGSSGGTYTSASFIDLYQNRLRILRGTNAGSVGEVAWWSMHNLQMALPAYTSATSFVGTAAGYLAFDSSGNIITVGGIAAGAGGSNTQIQYNNGGALTGTSAITFDGTTLVATGSFTGSFVGTLTGTASYASQALSSSYAVTASYALSVKNASDVLIYVKNTTGEPITKGKVVRISGATADNALISTASYESDGVSANTLGILNETIANDSFGYAMTEGSLIGIDTNEFTAGQLLFLGPTGSIIGTEPIAPLHAVRLGQALRIQSINGSMYVRIDNGYEIDELHNVLIVSGSDGDLLVASGSNGNGKKLYINSRQLTGSYGLTGSLTVSGSTRVIGTLNADGVQNIRQYNGTGNFLSGSLAIGKADTANSTLDVSGNAVITGSLDVTQALSVAGNTTITNGLVRIQGNSSNELVRITQTGTGAALIVEDESNPDTTPFVVDAAGNVGIGTSTPTNAKLDIVTSGSVAGTAVALRIRETSSNSQFNLTAFSSSAAGKYLRLSEDTTGAAVMIWTQTGNVGIGTSSPTRQLHTSGSIPLFEGTANTETRFLTFKRSDSSAESFVNYTGTDLAFGTNGKERLRIGRYGEIAIGITSSVAGARVYITGNDEAGNEAGVNPRTTPLLIASASSNTDLVRFTQTGTGNSFVVEDTNTPDSSKFVIDSQGNVGIGSSIPNSKLEINGNTIITGSLTVSDGGVKGITLSMDTSVGNSQRSARLFFSQQDSTKSTSIYATSGSMVFATSASYNSTSGLTRMFISESGNIGIGTSNPSRKLSVNGVFGVQFSDTTESFAVNPTSTGVDFVIKNGSTPSLGEFRVDTRIGQRAAYYDGGNFTIGSSSDDGINKLQVIGSAKITSGLIVTGSLNVTAGITGSLLGTSSFAITASNATGLSTLNQNVVISGSLTITNDISVLGSASIQYITSSQLNIFDNIISVNTFTPSVRFGGIAVNDSGSTPIRSGSLLFDSQNNQWIFVHQNTPGGAVTSSMLLMGPQTFNNVGNETALTANRVPKASGADLGEHLTDSNIEDTGTTVTINVADAGYASSLFTAPSSIATTVEDSGTGLYSSIYTEPNRISIGLYDAADIAISSINISQSLVRITGSLDVKSGITGSLFGTASWARNATTASFINVTNTNNASDYYIVGIDSDNGAQNPEQLYNFGTLAFNPDDNTLKVANGSGTMIGTASYATKAQNGFPYTGSAQITGSLGVTGSLTVSGSYNSPQGNTIDSNALIQASLLYLSNNF